MVVMLSCFEEVVLVPRRAELPQLPGAAAVAGCTALPELLGAAVVGDRAALPELVGAAVVAGRAALPETPPDGLILSLLLFDTSCSALCEASREEAGGAALPEALSDTSRSALFEAAREEAGRFIAVVIMDAAKTLEPHVRIISCMQEKVKKLWLRNFSPGTVAEDL